MDVLRWTLAAMLVGCSGCSAIYDFGAFHVTDASASDAGMDAAAPADGGTDAGLDAADAAATSADANVDTATDSGVLTVDGVLEEFANAACAKATRCEGKLGALGALEVLCHPGIRANLLTAIGLRTAGATVDDANARACLRVLESPDCAFGGSVDACNAMLHGILPDGAACTPAPLASGCASGACDGAACARCGARGRIGDPCGGASDPPCGPALNCHAGHCSGFLSLGDPCDGNGCGEGLLCDGMPSTCRPLPNVGEPCFLAFLGIDMCRGSLVCHDSLCVDGGGDGATCGGATDLPCRPGFRCGPTHTCVPISPPGGACLSRANCPIGFECVGEICVPLPVVGEACSPTLPCVAGGCRGGTCTLLPDGEACGAPLEPSWDTVRNQLSLQLECVHVCDGNTCASRRADGASCSNALECATTSQCSDPGTGAVCMACPP